MKLVDYIRAAELSVPFTDNENFATEIGALIAEFAEAECELKIAFKSQSGFVAAVVTVETEWS